MSENKFFDSVSASYNFSGKNILLGGAFHEGKVVPGLQVKIPLSSMNRHGLIAGATGTGKTKSIQKIAEALSESGVNVLLMDIKGDLSGIAKPGTENPKITERMNALGLPWTPSGYPSELLTISHEKGARLRATVSEFGPVLFSKILELNENQQGAIALVFKYCDDNALPLLDIKDFRAALQHVSKGEGKNALEESYGGISSASSGVIMRKLLELEQQGGDIFFGEKSFDVEDLLQKTPEGKAYINILRLSDLQDRPKLFSTFMLCLLAEVYNRFPEVGDKGDPKLVIFLDEAHLIFKEASSALMQQIETIVKLIRSKGIGIFFCTQSPTDIPDIVLSQLGSRIQHALRAFTAKDRKDIKLVAENFPLTEFYDTDKLITELGIGEALVTVLNEKGVPTELVHTVMCAPQSRMDILSDAEKDEIISSSELAKEYNEEIDRESAYEILKNKIAPPPAEKQEAPKPEMKKIQPKEEGVGETIKTIANSGAGKTILREVTRGLFGILTGKPARKSSKKTWW